MAYKKTATANTYIIRTADDLNQLATAGIITITSDTQLIFENISAISVTSRFEVTGGTLFLNSSGGTRNITYTGGSTFFTLSGDSLLDISEIDINGATTGTFITSTTSGQIEIDDCNLLAWDTLGTIVRSIVFALRNVQCIVFDNGFDIDCQNIILNTGGALQPYSSPSTPLYTITTRVSTATLSSDLMGSFYYPTDLFFINPNWIGQRIILNGSTPAVGAAIFDTSGSTGTFTAVSAVSSSDTITSVTDTDGIARFNFSGSPPVVYVGEEITISGFVTNTTYNGTFIITATDGVSYFTCASGYDGVEYTGTEASVGSFSATSVTITSTAHGLSDGDTITIDCDGATDYDGGYTIYNALTNTFQINATYTATQTGSWSTKGLDETDVRVISKGSPSFTDSVYIVGAYVNANSTNCGTIVNGTYKDCVFGTTGSALTEESNTERWKLIDDVSGTLEYTGNEPFKGTLTYDFTAYSSGGNEDFKFKWVKDSGSGFADLSDPIEALLDIGAESSSVSKTQHLNMEKGWKIKPQVTRVAGSSTVVISYATINAQQ